MTREIIQKWAIKANIDKRVYPHLFRHTKATALATKLTEPQLKAFAGWTPNSRMTGTYVHLSGADIDKAMLNIYGLNDDVEEKPSVLEPITCPRCQELNGASKAYCARCGLNLKEDIPFDTDVEIMKARLNELENDFSARVNAQILALIGEDNPLGMKLLKRKQLRDADDGLTAEDIEAWQDALQEPK
jgi:hypothetical protein